MPRKPRHEFTDRELAQIDAAYRDFMEEEKSSPMDYFQHDSDAHTDDALRALVLSFGDPLYGLAAGYQYWVLMELLTARKGHYYDVSTEQGWQLLAIDMSTCGAVMDVEECKGLIEALGIQGLISAAALNDSHRIISNRVCRNAEHYAKKTADKRIGAYKTNLIKAREIDDGV